MRPGCIRCATLRGVVDGSPSVTTLCGGFALALVPITHVSDQGYGIAPSVGTRRGFLMPRLCRPQREDDTAGAIAACAGGWCGSGWAAGCAGTSASGTSRTAVTQTTSAGGDQGGQRAGATFSAENRPRSAADDWSHSGQFLVTLRVICDQSALSPAACTEMYLQVYLVLGYIKSGRFRW